jgi:hypothetical protein
MQWRSSLYDVTGDTFYIDTTVNYHTVLSDKIFPQYQLQSKIKLSRHAAPRGRGIIAPPHSLPQHCTGVSGQRHAPAALYPVKRTPVPLDRRLGGPQSWSGHRGYGRNLLPLLGIKPRLSSL